MHVKIVEDYVIRFAKPFFGKRVGAVYVDPKPFSYEQEVPDATAPQALMAAANASIALALLQAGNTSRTVTPGDPTYLDCVAKVFVDGVLQGTATVLRMDDKSTEIANVRAKLMEDLSALQDTSWWPNGEGGVG